MRLPDVLQSVAALADGFISSAYPVDVSGWGSDSAIFGELIEAVRPRLIIEVGTWKGASALHMARCCDDLGLDTKIICVDTWLGAREFWTDTSDPTRYGSLLRIYGWPNVYYQFLANVVRAGQQDRIYPFPQTSLIAGRLLQAWSVQADLIYIDGSHDHDDVFADMRLYWPLVRKGGVLFGDDYTTFADVKRAVDTFGGVPMADPRYWRWQK